VDLVCLAALVQQDHPDFAPVARVDGGRAVGQCDCVFQCQAAARADLRLVARRQFDAQARRHQVRRTGLQHYALDGPQIQAGIFLGAVRVFGQERIVSESSDSDFH